MNAIVVDTSSWISYFSKKDVVPVIDEALKEGRVYLPVIVAAEIMSGISAGSKSDRMIDFLKELPLCSADFDHWLRTGELRSQLMRKGLTVSIPDAHIVQCCIDINCYLLSEDKIFRKIADHKLLKLIN